MIINYIANIFIYNYKYMIINYIANIFEYQIQMNKIWGSISISYN